MSSKGKIIVQNKETIENVCLKRLAKGTSIDTPTGKIPVQDLRPGMAIWTIGTDGGRAAAVVLSVTRVPVPPNHQVVRMKLETGGVLIASPEHPLIDGRSLSEIRAGDEMGGIK